MQNAIVPYDGFLQLLDDLWLYQPIICKDSGFSCKKQQPKEESAGCYCSEDEYYRMFKAFDENGDGLICKNDMSKMILKLEKESQGLDVESMLTAVDKDGDGFVNFKEFYSLFQHGKDEDHSEHGSICSTSDDGDDLMEAFETFDQNHDGFITAEELHSVLSHLGLGKQVLDCRRMIRGVDIDGDGRINFVEFKNMMQRDCRIHVRA